MNITDFGLHLTDQLNLGAAVIVALFSLVVLIRIERRTRTDNTEHRFLLHSFFCWWLAWLTWVAFWSFIAAGGKSNWMDFILSDLNTGLMILFYLGLTRGKELQIGEYFITGVTLAVVLVVGGLSFKWFPGAREPQILYGHWSLCLSMVAPILVGWGLRLRYGSSYVLVIAFLYALAQPPAYQSVLSDIEHSLPLPIRDAVLMLLAMLKIFFGSAVIHQVGFLPARADTVVRAPILADPVKGKDPYWPALPLALLGVGTISILVITIAEKQLWAQVREEFRPIGTWIIVIAAIIAIISNLKNLLGRKEKAEVKV